MRGLFTTILILAAGLVSAQSADPADLAFDAGDYDRALELYDARLEQHPDDVAALVQSGRLLSWRNQYTEAVLRYEQALALQPDHPLASLERAKVLSWDQRFTEAVDAFQHYLRDHPDDREARLGLARCLSWMRRFDESRQEFATVLEKDPDNIDAIVGTARTYAWGGDQRQAKESYERVLTVDPDNRDATLGLAYLYLWSGDPARAHELALRLQRTHPADDEVAQLTQDAARAVAPTVAGGFQRTDDTDHNVLYITRLDGGLSLSPAVNLTFGYTHWNLNNLDTRANIEYLSASVGLRPAFGQSLSVALGINREDNNINDEAQTDLLGGVEYAWGLDRPWQLTASAGRQALRYSPQITSNHVRFDYLTAGARGHVANRWHPFLDARYSDFSDGNDLMSVAGGFTYDVPIRRPGLFVGATLRTMNYAENTDSGYFDPQDFVSLLATAGANGRFGSTESTWRAWIETGDQSFELNGIQVDNDFVVVLGGALGFPIGRHLLVDARASWGNYAALTSSGYEARELGVALRWRGGP